MKRALGIDPGEHTGFAVIEQPNVIVHHEMYRCRSTRHDSAGMKFLLCEKRLREIIRETKPDIIAYETWEHHKGLYAAQALAGYLAIIEKVCEELKIPGIGLNVQEIKKHATANTQAPKAKMLRAAQLLWPKANIVSTDLADACHIARKAIHKVFIC